MKDNKKINEHIEKIKYHSNYRINETPKYTPIFEEDLEFDEVPQKPYSTQDGYPMPNVGGSDAYLEEEENEEEKPVEDEMPPMEEPEPSLEADMEQSPEEEQTPPMDGEMPPMEDMATSEEPVEDDNVNDIQNEIIKHNIEAMKSIQSKLEDLETLNKTLNSQVDMLSSKIKEVEEPTNAEKMMAKKDVSYPYYFNLNDFWKGNWFEQQREVMEEKGIKQLPDGTYIADFDDLPKHNDADIDSSFNNII